MKLKLSTNVLNTCASGSQDSAADIILVTGIESKDSDRKHSPNTTHSQVHLRMCFATFARESFQKVIRDFPQTRYASEAQFELGKMAYERNNFAEALEYLRQVAAAQPDKMYQDEQLLQYVGNCYYQAEEYDRARDALTKAGIKIKDVPARIRVPQATEETE